MDCSWAWAVPLLVDWPKEPSAQWDLIGKSQGQVCRLLKTALADSFATGFFTKSFHIQAPQTLGGGRNNPSRVKDHNPSLALLNEFRFISEETNT